MKQYLFTSERLGFRNWEDADLDPMAELNGNPQVMEHFPALQSREQTKNFIARMQAQFADKGYCYFAVDTLKDGAFIGFIGISEKTFESSFTPCLDIGWRLKRSAWNNGYATEGASRCLLYARDVLCIDKIYAMAPVINGKSIHVMEKIGMVKATGFRHPLLTDDERLCDCVAYVHTFR